MSNWSVCSKLNYFAPLLIAVVQLLLKKKKKKGDTNGKFL